MEIGARRRVDRDHAGRARLARRIAVLSLRHRGAKAAVSWSRSARGEQLWGFGLTEPSAGSDAGGTQTRAELRDGRWIDQRNQGVHHQHRHRHHRRHDDHRGHRARTNAAAARSRRSSCRRTRPASPARRSTGRWAGARPTRASCRSPTPAFRRRTCSASAGKGLKQFLTILDGGRISVAALSVGLAMGAYDEAFKYAQERHQFGKRSRSSRRSSSSSPTW